MEKVSFLASEIVGRDFFFFPQRILTWGFKEIDECCEAKYL